MSSNAGVQRRRAHEVGEGTPARSAGASAETPGRASFSGKAELWVLAMMPNGKDAHEIIGYDSK
jgi:hypothetical protein